MNQVHPEQALVIARLINDMAVSRIMCDAASRDADACRNAANYGDAIKHHERWDKWWEEGRNAAIALNNMGIPVLIPRAKGGDMKK